MSGTLSTEKFALFADLGIITVPENYVHGTQLNLFRARYQDGEEMSFFYYNNALTDANFLNPSCVLKPGDMLRLRVFKQTVGGMTTSRERMMFLKTQSKVVFPSAQGASLVWEQKRGMLPKGYSYCSLDERSQLWEDIRGYHWVSGINVTSHGKFSFFLGQFDRDWGDDVTLLCFCDESLSV